MAEGYDARCNVLFMSRRFLYTAVLCSSVRAHVSRVLSSLGGLVEWCPLYRAHFESIFLVHG